MFHSLWPRSALEGVDGDYLTSPSEFGAGGRRLTDRLEVQPANSGGHRFRLKSPAITFRRNYSVDEDSNIVNAAKRHFFLKFMINNNQMGNRLCSFALVRFSQMHILFSNIYHHRSM